MKIRVKRLWDGLQEKILSDQYIKVKKQIITHVSAYQNQAVDTNIDGLLMPGMIDCHLHIVLDGSDDPIGHYQAANKDQLKQLAIENLKKNIRQGITTVRDMGCSHDIDFELAALKSPALPSILACGNIICQPKGHGYWLAGREVANEQDVQKTMSELTAKGVRHIKLIATGGIMTKGTEPGAPELKADLIKLICQISKEHNLLVSDHAQGNEGIVNALKNGVTFIEHGFNINEETIPLFSKTNHALTPTFCAANFIEKNRNLLSDDMIEKLMPQLEIHRQSFKLAYKNKVNIVAGTDAGTPFNSHGNLLHEIMFMHENGMNIVDAFKSATSTPANMLNLHDRGVIEKGRLADMVAFEADTLDDIKATDTPIMTFKKGTVVD